MSKETENEKIIRLLERQNQILQQLLDLSKPKYETKIDGKVFIETMRGADANRHAENAQLTKKYHNEKETKNEKT